MCSLTRPGREDCVRKQKVVGGQVMLVGVGDDGLYKGGVESEPAGLLILG